MTSATPARSKLGAAPHVGLARRFAATKGIVRQPRADVLKADSTAPSSVRRRDIQALRAFAVMAVFAYHTVPERLPGGFVGVDIFFVVSGYLVGGALVGEAMSTGRVALARFYARRVRRIAPLATVVAVVTIVATSFTTSPLRLILWGSPAGVASVTRDGIASVSGVANLWFGVSNRGYAMDSYVSPFTHYWSLGVEEQFYLVAPFAIVLAFRAGRKVGALAIAAMSVLVFDVTIAGYGTGGIGTFYSPVSRAWELGIGVLVAIAVPWLRQVAPRATVTTGLVWISWVALAGCAVAIETPFGWPTIASAIPVGATAAILAGGAVREAGRLASLSAFQWLGDRSYAIYLWHWPVIAIAAPLSPFSREVTSAAVFVVTLVLSAASLNWIENPFRQFPLTSKREVRNMLVTGGVVVMSGLLVMASVGVWASMRPMNAPLIAQRYQLLKAGVAQQEFATMVPQNLHPDLLDASSDKPVADFDGCNVHTVFVEYKFSDCVYGTRGPVVALFGDSHALQWLDALLPAVERGDIRVALVTADGCPPFDPASLDYREVCSQWYRAAVDRVNALKPDLVIASTSLSAPELEEHGAANKVSLAVSGMASELKGAEVLWIVDTPAHDQNPSACAAVEVVDISSCSTPRNKALQPGTRGLVQQTVVANGWHWLDLNDYICDKTECGIILGDVFMYRDDGHLSATFARELSPVFMQAVLPLVQD